MPIKLFDEGDGSWILGSAEEALRKDQERGLVLPAKSEDVLARDHFDRSHGAHLFVGQAEIAVNVPMSMFSLVGTDDATTCMVLLVLNPRTNAALVSHLDSENRCESISHHVDRMSSGAEDPVDVYVCLGMILHEEESADGEEEVSQQQSQAILDAILRQLEQTECPCRLRLMSILGHNTTLRMGVPHPIIGGVGFVVPEGGGPPEVRHVRFPPSERGPCYALRLAASLLSSSHDLRLLVDRDCPVTEELQAKVVVVAVEPFVPSRSPPALESAEYLLSLGPEQLLQALSTSPHCEPANFVIDVKAAMRTFVEREKFWPRTSEMDPHWPRTTLCFTNERCSRSRGCEWKEAPLPRIGPFVVDHSRPLGSGSYGKVFRGMDSRNGQVVAVKWFYPVDGKNILQDEKFAKQTFREMHLLRKLGCPAHPNIVGLAAAHSPLLESRDEALRLRELLLANPAVPGCWPSHVPPIRDVQCSDLYLVFELFPGENLKKHQHQQTILSDAQVKEVMLQLLTGLNHIHRANVMHRDIKVSAVSRREVGRFALYPPLPHSLTPPLTLSLPSHSPSPLKPENILLRIHNEDQGRVEVKILDYGLARTAVNMVDAQLVQGEAQQPPLSDRVNTMEVVTPNYRSPEVGVTAYMDQPGLHGKVDVWSVGCVFVELLGMRAGGHRRLLVGAGEIIDHWRSLPPDAAANRTTAFANLLSSACGFVESSALDLVESMLRIEPRQRISTEQALRHPFFSVGGDDEGVFAFVPERQATAPPEALDARVEDGLERHNNLMLSIVDELLNFLP